MRLRLAVFGCLLWTGCVGGDHVCDPERPAAHAVRWEEHRFDGFSTIEIHWSGSIDLDGHYARNTHNGTESCSRTLAPCSTDAINLDDLDQAIRDRDVQAALETGARQGVPPALDGADWWWVISIDDRHFSYGNGFCEQPFCIDPPGVRALFELLKGIDAQAGCPAP